MKAIETVEQTHLTRRPTMRSGDTVRVHVKVREGDKERIQIFEGMVIGQHRGAQGSDPRTGDGAGIGSASSSPSTCTTRPGSSGGSARSRRTSGSWW